MCGSEKTNGTRGGKKIRVTQNQILGTANAFGVTLVFLNLTIDFKYLSLRAFIDFKYLSLRAFSGEC